MRILIVTQYFWPESFRINDLALAIKERGHHVEILTAKPNYPTGRIYDSYSFLSKRTEIWKGIKIHRAPIIPRGNASGFRLMLNYMSFSFFGCLRAISISGEFDKILVFEPSPITVGIPAILLKRIKKAPIYFWVQDLWPQSVAAAGGDVNGMLIKVLSALTKWIYNKSDMILIQSEAFRKIIMNQGIRSEKIYYYPNSVESFFGIRPLNVNIDKGLPAGFRIMFAGNIGEAQDIETMIETARLVKLQNTSVKWIILGDGRKKMFLIEQIKKLGLTEQIFLAGSFPVESMPDFFASADCLFVSLKKDYIFSLTIPSKIQSYLACGKPILASIDGEGGRIIDEAKAGLVSEAENPIKLALKVIEMAKMTKSELNEMGASGRSYFARNFERELLVDRLEEILAV